MAQNIYRPLVPTTDERRIAIVARSAVPGVTLLAIWLSLRGGSAIVPLLLMGYNLVTQLMPAVLLSLWERPRASAAGAFAGILAGELVVAYQAVRGVSLPDLIPSAPQAIKDLNIGIVALVANVLVLGTVSLFAGRSRSRTVE
jgi:SSS family solute:Na+ symporter